MICKNCSCENDNSAKFCVNCGQTLTYSTTDSELQQGRDSLTEEQSVQPKKPTPRKKFLKKALWIVAIAGIIVVIFFAVRASQPWISVDDGALCFHETSWKIFDFGLFKNDCLTLPHDITGFDRYDDQFKSAMHNFSEFKYDGTVSELCENIPWVFDWLRQGPVSIECDDFYLAKMREGALAKIDRSKSCGQKVIYHDSSTGESYEDDAVFVYPDYLVSDKDGYGICGFDYAADLIYWAETGIARPLNEWE